MLFNFQVILQIFRKKAKAKTITCALSINLWDNTSGIILVLAL
jgi:hypothetical protein